MPNSNLIQILIFVLVLAGPVIGKIGQWLVAQKQKRDAEVLRRKREEESFRTGREPEAEQQGPTAEQIEQMILAEQLRQQQEELQRQRAAQAEARRRAAQERAEAKRRQQEAAGETAVPAPTPAPVVRARADRAASTTAKQTRRAVSPQTPRVPVSASRSPSASVLASLDRDSLRQAIIMTEVLGPPVAMRDEHLS